MITAETITDAQLRELRASYRPDDRMFKICSCALGLTRGGATATKRARARCAKILNARAETKK